MDNNLRPRISVIVPVYNQQLFIGRCIRSLLHQSLSHSQYEIIVIDDGSVDLTTYALTQFCDPFNNVNLVTNKSNIGLPASLNKGINLAKGDFIVRVDSDDYVNYNYLSFLSYYLETNDDADAVACDYYLVDDKERILTRYHSQSDPIACGIMFRKNQLFDIGLYDETFLLNEEKELLIRFNQKFTLHHLQIPLYRYRKHSTNMTNDIDALALHDALLREKHKL